MKFIIAIKKQLPMNILMNKVPLTIHSYVPKHKDNFMLDEKGETTEYKGAARNRWLSMGKNQWLVMTYQIDGDGFYDRLSSKIWYDGENPEMSYMEYVTRTNPMIEIREIYNSTTIESQLGQDVTIYQICPQDMIDENLNDKTWKTVGNLIETIADKMEENWFNQNEILEYHDYQNALQSYHDGQGDEHFEKAGKRTEILHVGAELEVDDLVSHDTDEYLYTKLVDRINRLKAMHIRCETDGSLDDGGFEMITDPLTKETLKNTLQKEYESVEGFFDPYPGTTGLHFHIDLAWLTGTTRNNYEARELARLKMFTIVEGIFQDDCAIAMCRRSEDEINDTANRTYAHKAILEHDYDNKDVFEKVLKANSIMDARERYFLTNITCRETIELRFFAGVLDLEYLKMAVDVVFAIAEITKKANLGTAVSYTFDRLASFIKQRRKKYKDAYNYFVKENWI